MEPSGARQAVKSTWVLFQPEPAAPARRLAQRRFSPQQTAQQTSCWSAALGIPLRRSQGRSNAWINQGTSISPPAARVYVAL